MSQPASDAALGDLLAFVNAAPVGLMQLSPDGRIELINAMAARLLLPLSPDRRLDKLFDVLDGAAPGLQQQVADGGQAIGPVGPAVRLHVRPADAPAAAEYWLSLQLLRLDPRRLLAVLTDITRTVRDEQELQTSRDRLQFTLDAVQLGDWQLDRSDGNLTASAQFDRCMGHAGRTAGWTAEQVLQQVLPDERDALRESWREAVALKRPWHADFRVRWPDGSVHALSAHGHVPTGDGQDRRMVGVVIDVTAAREAQAARQRVQHLQAENRQMLATSRFKSQLLATLSHEFRTPLNAIIGFADLLQAGRAADDPARLATYLGHIRSSGRALLRLVNDMLDLSRTHAEGFDFVPQTVQPEALLRDVVELLADAAERKGLQVAVEVDPTLGPLHLDPFRLRQVVFNYFGNAVKFTPDGGQVTLRALPEGDDRVRIEVEDTGIGIADVDLPRLFTELQPLDMADTRRHDGAGLGLALTRRLVQAQGGEVGVRSTLGQGSVFHLVLPLRHPGAAAPALPER